MGRSGLDEQDTLHFAQLPDVASWMQLVNVVRDEFPGLETAEQLESYRQILLKNIRRETALCMKHGNEVVGVLLFSYHSSCLSCMAVHPDHRRRGIASALIGKMLELWPKDKDIAVTTFRAHDRKGTAPRALYKSFGFEEDELGTEFDYPVQKFILCRAVVTKTAV